DGLLLDGNHRANCLRINAGRVRANDIKGFAMTKLGIWKPKKRGGDVWISNSIFGQYNTTEPEFMHESNFTATAIKIDKSDCKITNTIARWCKICYEATGGIQNIYNCHFFQGGAAKRIREEPVLINWNTALGTGHGELNVFNTYLDNGCVKLYDKANIQNPVLLVDSDDVSLSGFFQILATGREEPRINITSPSFQEWDSNVPLCTFPDNGGKSWPDDFGGVQDYLGAVLNRGKHQQQVVNLHNGLHFISTNSNGPAVSYVNAGPRNSAAFKDINTTGPRMRVGSHGNNAEIRASEGFEVNAKFTQYQAQAMAPNAPDGSIALSDGSDKSGGWGATGPGFYKKLAGEWSPL
ncbi:MAG: hypothetical protein KUG74_06565, partial [Rhodobacteraceae bacterium]|nr:hypothetical protein [Paracoccaceae bacterium]